ncbi:MAG: Uma2 family endonuclease [Tepidisphaeraceae bacterium]
MTAAKQIQLLSVDDYLAGEVVAKKKHEYAGGYVYAMAGGRNVHNMIAGAFFGIIFGKLRGRPCQPFNSDTKVRIRMPTHTRFYYPDGMVVCEPNSPGDSFQDRPVVIAEVASLSTRRTDEGEKRDAYLTIPTLTAYLLIETERPRVVVHHRTPDGFVARVYEGIEATVPLDAIGTELSLTELYERVDFAVAIREADEEAEEWGFPREPERQI